jgi:hypothetical protein
MSYKKATYISLILFALMGAWFFYTAQSFPQAAKGQIGPDYFPEVIGGLLVIFCIISFITTTKKPDKHIAVLNKHYVFLTIGLSVLFVGLWQTIGAFYILSFIVVAIMLYFFNQAKHSFKKLLFTLAVSLGMNLFVYLVFERLFDITL